MCSSKSTVWLALNQIKQHIDAQILSLSCDIKKLKSAMANNCRACHARDNQSHPRPKISPLRLVPLPSRLLQIAEITRASPLRTSYVIQHRFASPQPNLEHLKTSPE